MAYTHRNGEKEPPTEPGVYRFFGSRYGKHLGAKDVELIVTEDIPGALSVLNGITYEGLEYYGGRWWGPVYSSDDNMPTIREVLDLAEDYIAKVQSGEKTNCDVLEDYWRKVRPEMFKDKDSI